MKIVTLFFDLISTNTGKITFLSRDRDRPALILSKTGTVFERVGTERPGDKNAIFIILLRLCFFFPLPI